jgi:hypothetical protein
MIGAPSLSTTQKQEPSGPPFVATSANNGLSVDPTTGKIVLGNDQGALGDPAQLLSNRDIFASTFTLELRAGIFGTGIPAVLSIATVGGAGNTFALGLASSNPNNSIIAVIANQGANSVGSVIQFVSDNQDGRIGTGGINNAIVPLRNAVMVQAVTTTSPDVALVSGQSAINVSGFIKFIQFILGVATETYRFLVPVTANLNFPPTAAFTSSDLTVNVPGAADGDLVSLGVPVGSTQANSSYTGFVSAPGVVTVRFCNFSALAIDPAAGNFKVAVTRLLPP